MWQNFQMRHVLPPVIPAFRDAVSTDPIQQIALRVVVELPNWEFHTIGSCLYCWKPSCYCTTRLRSRNPKLRCGQNPRKPNRRILTNALSSRSEERRVG